MSSFNFKHVYNPSLLDGLVADAQKEKSAHTRWIIERIRQDVTEGMQPDTESLFGTSPLRIDEEGMLQWSHAVQASPSSSIEHPTEESSASSVLSTDRQRTGILTRIHSLFGHSRRTRRDQQKPAIAQILDKRQLMSGTPATVAIDTAHWGTPQNGAQASAQSLPGKTTYDLGLSPDGSTFATANGDGSIHLFDAATGVDMKTLSRHTALLTGVEYNPSGTLIASTGYDKTVKIWDAATGALQKSISIANLGTDLLWSPDGTSIAVGVVEQSVTLINAQTGSIVRTFPIGGEACRFTFVKGGAGIAIGHGAKMKVFGTATGAELLSLEGLPGQIYATGSSKDGSLIAAGDNSGQVAIWDAATGTKLWQQSGHGPARSIAFAPDGRHIIVAGHTGKITVYDATTLKTGQMTVVKDYMTPAFPQSIIVSPTNQTFMLTTSDNTTTSRTMVFDLPDPPTDVTPDLHTADAIAEVLEREQQRIYPRMFISATPVWNGSEGHTNFSVRLSNPGDKSFIQVAGVAANGNNHRINETIYHPGGIADAQWNFDLKCRYGNVLTGAFTVTLYTDETRTTILDCTTCTFNNEENSGSVVSEQYPWEHMQQGLLEEHPIVSDMKIVKIEGPTLLLSVASPYDQSVVNSITGGLLSSQTLKHEGGTAFNLSRITFNTGMPTGDYPIQLCDRTNGKVTDTIIVHWDKSTKKLTSVDSTDMMSAERALQTDTAAFDAIMSLTTANLDDSQLNWIQQVRSYEMTKDLDAEHNFYIDGGEGLMAKIFAVHPEYREENWTKAIEALVGPKDKYGRTKMTPSYAKDFFHRNRLDFIRTMRDALGAYEANMGTIMQKAIDIYIQISHGADERVQVAQLDALIAQCLKDRKLAPLSQIRIFIPSRGKIMEAAGQVYAKSFTEMIGRQKDVVKFREASDRMRELGLRQTAAGEWQAVSEDTTIALPPDMTRREISLAAKIKSTLASSTDPRIVAYTNTVQNAIALQVAKNLPENATGTEIVRVTTIAMADADYSILHDNSTLVGSYGTDGYRRFMALHSYSPSVPVTGYTAIEQQTIASTGAGQMFLGMAQAAEHSTVEKLLEIEAMIAAATGIKQIDLHPFVSGPATAKDRPKSLEKLLMRDPTYATIFSHLPETTPRVTASSASIIGNSVRIRFDYHAKDGRYDRGNIYLLNAQGQSFDSQKPLVSNFSDTLYVDIPFDTIRQYLEETRPNQSTVPLFSFKVALWDDTKDKRGLEGNNTTGTLELDLRSLHLSVSDDPIENAILDQMAKQLPVRASDGNWVAYIGSNAHDGTGFHALDINLSGSTDRDKDILAVVGGTISSINLNYGTIVIDHPAIGNTPAWQTKYLHTPLRVTNEYAANGKLKYGFADKNGVISDFRIWEDMHLDAGQKVAIVAGRGMTSDTDFDIHLHQEAIVNGQSINMFNLVEKQWGINVQADDDNGGIRDVEWIQDLSSPTQQGFYGNRAEKIIFYRDKTQSADSSGNYWVAWQDGVSVEQMQKVRWAYLGKDIHGKDISGWQSISHINGSISIWESTNSGFIFTPLNIYKLNHQMP